jgi:hypothetical protein
VLATARGFSLLGLASPMWRYSNFGWLDYLPVHFTVIRCHQKEPVSNCASGRTCKECFCDLFEQISFHQTLKHRCRLWVVMVLYHVGFFVAPRVRASAHPMHQRTLGLCLEQTPKSNFWDPLGPCAPYCMLGPSPPPPLLIILPCPPFPCS